MGILSIEGTEEKEKPKGGLAKWNGTIEGSPKIII
jgi:hypothetical protein